MTFQQAVESTTASCPSMADKLKHIKVLLDATEQALFASATSGGVTKYKVNTGQTVIEVDSTSPAQLRTQLRELWAYYNELCGLYSGSNVMVMRDASTLGR